jgi:hypothetical protein
MTGDGLGDALGFLKGPASWIKGKITGKLAQIGDSPFAQMLIGMGKNLASSLMNRLTSIGSSFEGLTGVGAALGRAAGSGLGGLQPGILGVLGALRGVFGNVPVISGFRAGSRTLTGNVSYHASGRAIDIPPVRGWAAYLNAIFGSRLRELITPWQEYNIHNGQPHTYTGAVWNQHNFAGGNAHIHAAMDHGGFLLPGWNMVPNWTGRPEPVTPANTMDELIDLMRRQNELLAALGPDIAQALTGQKRQALMQAKMR